MAGVDFHELPNICVPMSNSRTNVNFNNSVMTTAALPRSNPKPDYCSEFLDDLSRRHSAVLLQYAFAIRKMRASRLQLRDAGNYSVVS